MKTNLFESRKSSLVTLIEEWFKDQKILEASEQLSVLIAPHKGILVVRVDDKRSPSKEVWDWSDFSVIAGQQSEDCVDCD